MSPALFMLLLFSPGGGGPAPRADAAIKIITRCPKNTRPIRTADARTPWACMLLDERYQRGIDCPSGYKPVTTADPYDPFKCALKGVMLREPRGICPPGHRSIPTSDQDKDYECEKVEKGLSFGPRCPGGTTPVPTPGALRPFKCVTPERTHDPDPEVEPDFAKEEPGVPPAKKPVRCPRGTRRVQTENPFEPVQCVDLAQERKGSAGYQNYRVKGQISFDYPKGWHLTDAWTDEVPSILLIKGTGRDGRPVSLTISRQRRDSPSYQEMSAMIRREQEWHDAKTVAGEKVGGLTALHLSVKGESDTAYLETGDGYYVLSFSAPPDQYARFSAAYRRLLQTFRHLEKKKK